MTFEQSIKALNVVLTEKQPEYFSPSWIQQHVPKAYYYIWGNIRTENNDIDWDKVTSSLDRTFQPRWMRYRQKQVTLYESQAEVDAILINYTGKLYTFLVPGDANDKLIQQKMIISLVRIGQKGNVSAQNEIVKWITYITDEWIDSNPQIGRWKGYTDEVEDKIRNCIRCYRYTGSFLNYLFRTLLYSARGKPPLCSVDDKILGGKKTRLDYLRVDEDEE